MFKGNRTHAILRWRLLTKRIENCVHRYLVRWIQGGKAAVFSVWIGSELLYQYNRVYGINLSAIFYWIQVWPIFGTETKGR